MDSNRNATPILFGSLVIVMLGFGIAIPLMPFYMTHFNASAGVLGLMMAIYSLMQFIFAPVWGRVSDRIGRKPVLMIGIAGFFFAFVLQGLSQDIVQFVLVRSLAGILSSATLPTAMAYMADITSKEDRSKGVGMMGAAIGLGMVMGPALGGVLTHINLTLPEAITRLLQITTDAASGDTINLSIPFFASALLALIAMPLIQFVLPESLTPEKRAEHAAEVPSGESRLKGLLAGLQGAQSFLFVMAFLLSFALANMESVLGLYGNQRFQMGPSEIGVFMAAIGLLSAVQQGVMIGPLTRRFGEERIIQGALVIGIVGFIGMALAPVKWALIVATLVFNSGNVLLQPSVTALISRRTQGGQGAAMGLNNSFQSLGRVFGPIWAGTAYDIQNTLSFWTGALIQLAALFYSFRVLKGEPAEAAAQASS